MNVIVACEFSGVIREAFRSRGHNAVSCDFMDTEIEGPHYKGDVRDILDEGWDLMIAHPPCTYLCNSGVRWLHERPERWELMKEGAEFFRELLEANIPHICVENPVPHRYAVEIIGRKYSQIIQPYQFGHGETKATCLWLKYLPPLQPTEMVEEREQRIWKLPPSPDRSKERSRTYEGIAEAMAEQWSMCQSNVPELNI